MDVEKAGWLYKHSSMLHRWKKKWLVLDHGGVLHVFKSPDTQRPDHFFVLRACCLVIKSGSEVHASPPADAEGGADCLIQLKMRDGYKLVLSATSIDDSKGWLTALEQAKGRQASAQPPLGFKPMIHNQQGPPPTAMGPVIQNQGPCPVLGSGFAAGGPQVFVSPPPPYGFGRGHSLGTTTYPDPYTGTFNRGAFSGKVISAPPPGHVINAPQRTQVMRNMDGSKTTVINPDGNTLYMDQSFPASRQQRMRYYRECQNSGIAMPTQIFQPM